MNAGQAYQSKYSNSWALIIGINKYVHTSPLNYATNDAQALAEILKQSFKFPKQNISLLLDEKATKKTIHKLFMDFTDKEKIKPDDRFVVFFAGHGHTVQGRRGEVGFLIPVDGKPKDLNTLIRWDELTRNADLIPAKHMFFLMDACYGGLALLRTPAFGSMRFMGDMLKRYARQVLTAGKADETVADGSGVRPGNSIFTAHLLNGLEGQAATENGIIAASGIMAYVYQQVAHDQYSHQTPHYGFVDGDGDFIFDTSLLDAKRKAASTSTEINPKGEKGEEDILINTSPPIAPAFTSEDSVVDKIKELLSVPSKRIKLADFVNLRVRHFLDAADLRHFPVQGVVADEKNFIERIHKYEEIVKDLQQIAVLIAQWGEGEQLDLLEKIFTRLAEADKGSSGTVLWLRLSWYPILVLVYSVGMTALATRKYDALRIALLTPVHTDREYYNDGHPPLMIPTFSNILELREQFKLLPGHERHYVPRSEYLYKNLQPILEDALFLGKSYESTFDEFEIMAALTFSDVTGSDWGPPGRFAWKNSRHFGEKPFTRLVEYAKKSGENWEPLKVGFFGGSLDRFNKIVNSYSELLSKLNWW